MAKASVLEQFQQPLRLREFPLPAGPEPGAALVRTEMAGVCGTDVHLWKGELPIPLPVILGHETVGRIVQLGAGLETDWTGQPLETGDRVAWNSTSSCGTCFYCAKKRQPTRCPHRRAYGIGYRCDRPPHFLGGYAEFHYLNPGVTLFKLPSDLSTESVIGSGCALITALHGVERICVENPAERDPGRTTAWPGPCLPERWRDWVVVQGAGPVGIAALAVAKSAGARKTIVIGAPRHRLDLARRFGADHILNLEDTPNPAERVRTVQEWTGGYGADTVLECVGQPSAVTEGMEMCRDGGKYLVLGHYCDAGSFTFNPHLVTRKQLQVFGSWSSEPRHLRAAVEFLQTHREEFPFHTLVTHRFPLAEANRALETTAHWQSAKSVIVPP
jgi:threonine dehydrogenase-like Zn-dependent dehydrogenase